MAAKIDCHADTLTHKACAQNSGDIKIGTTLYSTIDVVTGSYVSIICSNPFNFDNDYRFGFNGKEKDNEIKGIGNSLNFGARWMDTRTGRLGMTIDPLFKKYPSQSPYVFAGNNPILYIDKDGKEIWVSHVQYNTRNEPITTIVQYKNGELFEKSGEPYKGNDEYILGVKNDLNNLKGDHIIVKYMVNELEHATSKHIISKVDIQYSQKENEEDDYYKRARKSDDDPHGSMIRYNARDSKKYFNGKEVITEKRNRRVGLGHELKHAFDIMRGKFNNYKTTTSNGIPIDEVEAQNVENLIREKTGDPLNTDRSGKEIPKENLWDSKENKDILIKKMNR